MAKSLSSTDVLKALKAAGWMVVRQTGSHIHLRHAALPGTVTVPAGRRDLAKGTLRSIERQAKLRF